MAQDETRPTSSPDPHMMLVPYQRGQRTKRIGIWIVSVLLTAVLCFAAGYYRGIRQNLHMVEQRKEMRTEIADLQQQLQKLQEDAAIHRHGNELERQASERVRKEAEGRERESLGLPSPGIEPRPASRGEPSLPRQPRSDREDAPRGDRRFRSGKESLIDRGPSQRDPRNSQPDEVNARGGLGRAVDGGEDADKRSH